MQFQFPKFITATALIFSLYACGGGGKTSTPPPTQPPINSSSASSSIASSSSNSSSSIDSSSSIASSLSSSSASPNILAWLGEKESYISLSADTIGMELFSSTAPDCDWRSYANCADGKRDIIQQASFIDSTFTLNNAKYYQLKNGIQQAPLILSGEPQSLSNRRNYSAISFQNKLWLIGGTDETSGQSLARNRSFSYKNDIWSSDDGIHWQLRNVHAEFSPRENAKLTVHDGKLWLAGGSALYGTTNDVWSSEDGVHWVLQATETMCRNSCEIASFANKLWFFVNTNLSSSSGNLEIWTSLNGRHWEKIGIDPAIHNRINFRVTTFNNQLLLIGGTSPQMENYNDIWSTKDGVSWEKKTENAAFPARGGFQLVTLNSKLFLIAGKTQHFYSSPQFTTYFNDIWSSVDGINWTQEAATTSLPNGEASPTFNVKNQLIMVGNNSHIDASQTISWTSLDAINWSQQTGQISSQLQQPQLPNGIEVFHNKLWALNTAGEVISSPDGLNWSKAANILFPQYKPTLITFNDKLWLLGGSPDVWSSADGSNWSKQANNLFFGNYDELHLKAFNKKLWLIGGIDDSAPSDQHNTNSIWSSTDGINWTQEIEHAAFSARSGYKIVELNDRLFLIGGTNSADRFYHNEDKYDVWSSADGKNWILEADRLPADVIPWSRVGYSLTSHSNKIWLIGGSISGSVSNDIWSSSDGKTWELVKDHTSTGFSPRSNTQTFSFNNNLYLVGGASWIDGYLNIKDIWRSENGIDWYKGVLGNFDTQNTSEFTLKP